MLELKAAADDDGRRLDRILRKALKDLPLSGIHKLLRKGSVLVNGKKAGANYLVKTEDSITVNLEEKTLPSTSRKEKPAESHTKRPPLDIIYRGEGLLILNKPTGQVVHGGKDSLEDMVLSYLKPELPPSLSFKPGPLHRLDKPSSGLIVFSTSLEGARSFSTLMRERKIKKYYLAIVEGEIREEQTWQDNLTRDKSQKKTKKVLVTLSEKLTNTKTALTKITPIATSDHSGVVRPCTLIKAEIVTGRTHQIRAQAASHGHPLLGDVKYGGKMGSRLFLHAWRIEIPPSAPSAPSAIYVAPLPEAFQEVIDELFGNKKLDFLKSS